MIHGSGFESGIFDVLTSRNNGHRSVQQPTRERKKMK